MLKITNYLLSFQIHVKITVYSAIKYITIHHHILLNYHIMDLEKLDLVKIVIGFRLDPIFANAQVVSNKNGQK